MDTQDTQKATQPLVDDAIKVEQHISAMVSAYKAGGFSAVAAMLPALAPEIEKDYEDVKVALPTIKAGYKTTEFWIVVGSCGFISIMGAAGKVPPTDAATIIGALSGVYAVVRGLIKK